MPLPVLYERIARESFPTEGWGRRETPDAVWVRTDLILGVAGESAARCARRIDAFIGPESRNRTVCIPFRTRDGHIVTLFGGWIHATDYVSWDVIGDLPDGRIGDWDEVDDRPFDGPGMENGYGLACRQTVEFIRILRML